MANVTLDFELAVESGLWGPFETICVANGEDPLEVITQMCTTGMQLSLEEMTGIEDGVTVEEAEVDACYADAVVAVSQWLSAKRGIPLVQAQQEAVEYLATL